MQMLLRNSLKAFPFLNSRVVLEGLKGELSSYLAMVPDIDADIEILRWWQQNEAALPCWAAAAWKVYLYSLRLQHQKGFFCY